MRIEHSPSTGMYHTDTRRIDTDSKTGLRELIALRDFETKMDSLGFEAVFGPWEYDARQLLVRLDADTPAVEDAKELLRRISFVRDLHRRGDYVTAIREAALVGQTHERMCVRYFEPDVIRGQSVGPSVGRQGGKARWAKSEKARNEKRDCLRRMFDEYQEKNAGSKNRAYLAVAAAYNRTHPNEKQLKASAVEYACKIPPALTVLKKYREV